ncbi:MAG TPA: hypothetical protein VD995_26250 [Azospirillum sp.]|nr:hypothetical protein [Azospirillum sp.]
MNAETGNEPESPKRRGRIPQSAWPQILERYRAGATLSAIAREFECTPSAISYIVRKAEASGALPPGEGAATEEDPTQGAESGSEQAAVPAEAVTDAQPQPQAQPQPRPQPAPRRAAPAPAPAEARPAAEAPPAPAAAPAAPPKQRLELPRAEVREAREAQRAEALRAEAAAAAPAPQPAPAAPAPSAAPAQDAAARTPGQPTPPIDALEGRLRETARTCLAAYRGWRQQPSEGTIQSLSDAVHELRKALARIEIDMSASRRDEQVMRPIPIPAHRTSRRTPS